MKKEDMKKKKETKSEEKFFSELKITTRIYNKNLFSQH